MEALSRMKIHPPRWDSAKDREEFPTFETNYESFVKFAGGRDLWLRIQRQTMNKALVGVQLC